MNAVTKKWIYCEFEEMWVNLDHLSKIRIEEKKDGFHLIGEFPDTSCSFRQHLAGPFEDEFHAIEYFRAL